MGEAEDRLALALIEANLGLTDLRVQLSREKEKIKGVLREIKGVLRVLDAEVVQLRKEKAQIKGVLRELHEEGVIDLEQLARHTDSDQPKAERRDILRPD